LDYRSGHESESTFGLNRVNFGFRSYNPTIGLFDGADPLGDINAAYSPMAYVNGDPVNNIDIDGLYASNTFDGKPLGDGGGRLPGAPEEEKYQGKPKATIVAAEANYASLRAGIEAFKGAMRGLGQLAHDLAPIRMADQNDPKTLGESWQNIKNIPSNLAKLPSQLGEIYSSGDIGQKTQATVQFTGAILGMLKGKAPVNGLILSKVGGSSTLLKTVVHGNSLKSLKPTWFYKLYSKDGTFLKNGITNKKIPETRYSKSYMLDKFMDNTRQFPNRLKA
jgi:RHS repeat-associated protein